MNESRDSVTQIREDILNGFLTRRQVLQRAFVLGLSAPLIAGLLAACGDDDDDDDTDTDGGGGQAEPTATAASAEGEPTEAGAEGEATEAEEEATEADASEATEAEGDATEAEGDATEAEGGEEPAGERGGGGKVTLLYWQAPTILNVHLSQGTKDDHASRICTEPLFEWDINTEPVLVLAEEWPTVENELLDPDGMFVIWKLKQGVKWHDGEDFTAEDVAFTWEWVTAEGMTATTLGVYMVIESIDIIDDYTVQLNFAEPNPAWFDPFSGVNGQIIPEHYFRDFLGESGREAPGNLEPIGTGPFRVTSFNPGDTVLYEMFEDYWDPGKPFFDEVEVKGGGDAASAARAVVVTGEADWAWNLQVEPQVLNQMVEEGGEGEIITIPGNSAERIFINFADPNTEVDGAFAEPTTQHPLWQHMEAREALNLAIQRDVIAEQLYGPGNEPTALNLNVPEKFKPDWEWSYDLDAARERLAAINFPDDFESTNLLYQTSVNSVRQKNQEIVKADLEELGFTVELKSVDSGVYFSSDAGNPDTLAHFYADIQMYTNGPTSPYPISWAERFRSDDIAQKSNSWSGTNSTRWNNPAYDELHDRAKTTIDEDEQVEIWHEMMLLPLEEIVEVPIVWRGGVAAVHNRIKNYTVSNWTGTPTDDLKNWTL